MKHLELTCTCLEGNYTFTADTVNGRIVYSVITDIENLASLEGRLGFLKSRKFSKLLDKTQIEKWDSEYTGESGIEDAVKWKVSWKDDEKEYSSKGEESYYPYNWEYLLEAIALCDRNIEYFK